MLFLLFLPAYVGYIALDVRAFLRTRVYENRGARALKFGSVVLLSVLVWLPLEHLRPLDAGDYALVLLAFAITLVGIPASASSAASCRAWRRSGSVRS